MKKLIILFAIIISACGTSESDIQTAIVETEKAVILTEVARPNKTNEKDGMEFVYVPAGEFEMGRKAGIIFTIGYRDERPAHTVYLDAYWIGKYEVTNQQYATFLNENEYRANRSVKWILYVVDGGHGQGSSNPGIEQFVGSWVSKRGYVDHPVVKVTWYGAKAYCEWAGGRLPTEAEWEKAARGIDGRTYPWGEGIDASLANYGRNVGETTSVGNYPAGASPYGALDMAGNVWEWVADWYDEDYYSNTETQNPIGPAEGKSRMLRGGSWYVSDRSLRAASREWAGQTLTTSTGYDSGFRCLSSQ